MNHETRRDPKNDDPARFIGYLEGLKNDRGAMAELRCALSPARRTRAWPLLGPVGGIEDICKETIAGLFAHHPDKTGTGNIGTTCRELALHAASFDSRFRRLLACGTRQEVCERLRPLVLAAKSKGVPINYEQLYVDLHRWGARVKAEWARAYWVTDGEEEVQTPAGATA